MRRSSNISAGGCRRRSHDRPVADDDGQDVAGAESIAEPAARHLKRGVGPDECTEDDPHCDLVEAKFLGNDRCRGRNVHAIQIGDQIHQTDQYQDVPAAITSRIRRLRCHGTLHVMSSRICVGRLFRPLYYQVFSTLMGAWSSHRAGRDVTAAIGAAAHIAKQHSLVAATDRRGVPALSATAVESLLLMAKRTFPTVIHQPRDTSVKENCSTKEEQTRRIDSSAGSSRS